MMRPLIGPYRGRLAFIMLTAVLGAGFTLGQPYLTKIVIDGGILGQDTDLLLRATGWLVGLALLSALMGLVNRWLYIDTSSRILFALRSRVFSHLLTLSPAYFARNRRGDIMTRLDGDVAGVQRFAIDGLLAMTGAVILLFGSVVMMLALSPFLTLIAFALVPLQLLFLKLMRPWLTRRSEALRARSGELASHLVERLGAVKLIQSLNREGEEERLLNEHQSRYRRDLLRSQLTSYATGAGPGLLMTAATALVFVTGGIMAIEGKLTLGTLIAFTAYMGRAVAPAQTLFGLYATWAPAAVSFSRILAILDERPVVTSPAHPRELPAEATGSIRFVNVSYAHDGQQGPGLVDINFVMPGGKKCALVGPSGAGKSTLVDLLLRFHDPDRGQIFLDDVDIRDLQLAALRKRIAIVSSDSLILHGTLADNLRLVRDASDGEIHDALEAAELGDFLRGLPNGLQTVIAEQGRTLSAGERQRLALARALLLDPLVLVLDEATSQMDADTERKLMTRIDSLFARRSRIVISHHERSFRNADMTLRLHDSRIVVS